MRDNAKRADSARQFSNKWLGGDFGAALVWFIIGLTYESSNHNHDWMFQAFRACVWFSLLMLMIAWFANRRQRVRTESSPSSD